MAEISLRDYLSKLDSLLAKGAPSEVIHHCRHILQYYPKNADTYRILGRALFNSGSWQEAGEVFRRVLSVYPDDYTAHTALSEIYLRLKRPDDAIWHLERAFELDPNNQPVLDNLRELYRRHRKIEHSKVQLTAGAVARQYLRNGLYEQAIDTLQQALQRSPERVDLRLLLATTQQEAGHRVEAAEVALEVLKVLPDSLVANRILTELWLAEQRPSDAQRYLNRIQSVDPYLALELAQGQEVPNDAFKLEELDYRRTAERELMTQAPDWLRDVDQTPLPASPTEEAVDDSPAWLGSFAPSPSAPDDDELPVFDESFSTELPNDWLSDIPDSPPSPPAAEAGTAATSGLFARFNQPAQPAEPEPIPEPDLDALFGEQADNVLPVDKTSADESLPDFFAEETPAAPAPTTSGNINDADPLAWLHESGIEIVDNPPPVDHDLFGAEDDHLALQDADAADPLAWLQGYGGEYIDEKVATAERERFVPMDESSTADDPLSWLESSDIEQAEITPSTPAEEPDPLDWLADETLLDEALSLEALIDLDQPEAPVARSSAPAERQETMSNDDLDWLSSTGDEPEDGALPDWLTGAVPSQPQGDTEDWFAETSADAQADVPDWLSGGHSTEPASQAEPAGEMPDWFAEMDAEEPVEAEAEAGDVPDWLSAMSPQETDQGVEAADTGGLEWMSAEEDDSPASSGIEGMPDWLSEAQPGGKPVADIPLTDDTPDWLSEMQPDEAAEPEPVMDTPEWLSEMQPDDESVADVSATADTPDWLSEMQLDEAVEPEPVMDTPDWLSEMQPEEAAEPEPVMDTPDWLSEMQPDDQPVADVSATADTPDWLSEMQPDDEPIADASPAADTPDWLSEMQPDEAAEPEPVMDTPDWLSEMQPDDEPVADVSPTAETPDWLSEMQPDETAEPEPVMDTPDWLSEMQPDDEPVADVSPTADTPDWLSEMQPDEAAEYAEASGQSSDSDFEVLPPPEQEVMSDVPEWVASIAPTSAAFDHDEPATEWQDEMPYEEEAGEPEVMGAAAGSGFEWMSEESDQPESELSSDSPDWLEEMRPAEETAVSSVEADDGGFEWMSSGEEAISPAESGIEDMPSWLSEAAPITEPITDGKLPSDTPDWLDEAAMNAEAAFEVMNQDDDTPDWSSALGDQAEPAPEGEVPDWLNDIRSEDEAEPEPADDGGFEWMSAEADDSPASSGIEDMPDWLSEDQPGGDPVADIELEANTPEWLQEIRTADEAPSASEGNLEWMSEAGGEEDEAISATGIEDMPDWLSEAQPTAEQTTMLDEDAYAWEDDLAETEASQDLPDWVNNIQSQQSETVSQPDDVPMSSEFSWIDDINAPAEEEDSHVPETVMEADDSAADDFDFDAIEEVDPEAEYAETIEEGESAAPVPASNAPDWLNAMVPGLDVDYDAPEDEPIEQSFIEAEASQPAARVEQIAPVRNRREFDWLSQIVEEETNQMSPVEDTGRLRRFIFSKQPVWLRKPTERRDPLPESSSTSSTDDDFDFDDVDLPPWLQ